MTIRKGKFIRRMIELMTANGGYTVDDLFRTREVGPTIDYVQTNLNKMVVTGEVVKSGDVYSLPKGITALSDILEEEGILEEATLRAEATVDTWVKTQRLPREIRFETFLGICYMSDIPKWNEAADYYCLTHNAKWSIVSTSWGERLNFFDEISKD